MCGCRNANLATVSPSHADGGMKATWSCKQLVGPRGVLPGVPAPAAEQHHPEFGLADQLQVVPAADLVRGLPGQPDRRLDGLGVGIDPVHRQREPQRQAPGPPGEVVGVVGRVPLARPVVDDVQVGGVLLVHRTRHRRFPVQQGGAVERGEQPLVRVHDERVGVLDPVVGGAGRSARTGRPRRRRRPRGTTAGVRAPPRPRPPGRRRCPRWWCPRWPRSRPASPDRRRPRSPPAGRRRSAGDPRRARPAGPSRRSAAC